MQALYQASTRNDQVMDFIDYFVDTSEYDDEAKLWGKQLSMGAWDVHEESDQFIKEYSIGWSLDRINLIDLSILRLAFYELSKKETPVNVVLDEAVELAKEFSTSESSKFINGILGKFVTDHVHRDH